MGLLYPFVSGTPVGLPSKRVVLGLRGAWRCCARDVGVRAVVYRGFKLHIHGAPCVSLSLHHPLLHGSLRNTNPYAIAVVLPRYLSPPNTLLPLTSLTPSKAQSASHEQ